MDGHIFITLMRHGRSRADDEGVHEGRYDSPLTDKGFSQAQTRAYEFVAANLYFDRIICSPLIRAHQTANIIGQELNIPVETDPDWMEFNNGPLAGLPFAVADERYPKPDFRNPFQPFHGSGESDWETHRRGNKAIENIIRHGPGSYLVVAHGGILNAAMRSIVGAPPFTNEQGLVFGFGDTGYIHLTYQPMKNIWLIREFAPGEREI